MTPITNQIRRYRFERGEMTQQALAEACGVTRQTIIALEAGRYAPSLELAFRIARALDVRIEDGMPYAATHGWVKGSGQSLWAVMDAYADFPSAHVMCTDIGRDGMMTGPNIWLYEVIRERYPHLQLQASGGVSCLEDLSALRRSGLVSGVIVGKALYAGKFTIQEALAC